MTSKVSGLALLILREAKDLKVKDLAAKLSCSPSLVSRREKGLTEVKPEDLALTLEKLGWERDHYDWAVDLAAKLREAEGSRRGPQQPEQALKREIAAVAREEGQALERFLEDSLTRVFRRLEVAHARTDAPRLWARLRRYPADRWSALAAERSEYRSWALVELLCEESLRAASGDAGRALELANFAVVLSQLLSGDEFFLARIRGYAWAHLANARRAASQLPAAAKAFGSAKRLWKEGAAGDPGILNEARVLGLEAALRRDQRRLDEALDLLDEALAVDRGDEKVNLLVTKAHTLHVLGEDVRALAALEQAAPLVEGRGDRRLLFGNQFDQMVLLCAVGRSEEAEKKLGTVRMLAEELGEEVQMTRIVWLEAKVAAAQRRWEEAVAAYEQVRRDFIARGHAYDQALVSAELARALLELGRTSKVMVLASEMQRIFQGQEVHEEASKAVALFREAAARETVTVDLAERLVVYLRRAQHDPGLRFAA